jgi:A/G-specific adenine glycosylase
MMNFTTALIGWYKKNKRDLPWRQTRDPYKIWLSEIILQQTRIDQGRDYYIKFVTTYPDVHSLANASEHDVLKLWQGLGYYTRARNLHQTAIAIVNDFKGQFPDNYNGLIKLKGIGEYTAAAISSIAFKESRAVVDGNVSRFLSRFNGIKTPIDSGSGKKIVTGIAMKLIDPKQPGEFNQALMEFGSLYCKPQNPDCIYCIFKNDCKAYLNNQVSSIPVKAQKLAQKKRYFHYLFIIYKDKSVYLKKRLEQDIWRNLYDFPLLEKNQKTSQKKILDEISNYFGTERKIRPKITISREYNHILSHQQISARFYTIPLNEMKHFKNANDRNGNSWAMVELKKINEFPIPRLIEKFLKNNQLL